jgi:hypothetical protein
MVGPLAKFEIVKAAATAIPQQVKPEQRRNVVVASNSAAQRVASRERTEDTRHSYHRATHRRKTRGLRF